MPSLQKGTMQKHVVPLLRLQYMQELMSKLSCMIGLVDLETIGLILPFKAGERKPHAIETWRNGPQAKNTAHTQMLEAIVQIAAKIFASKVYFFIGKLSHGAPQRDGY
jgi:hypothetical protein